MWLALDVETSVPGAVLGEVTNLAGDAISGMGYKLCVKASVDGFPTVDVTRGGFVVHPT